jgi:cell volume regulation protein A
MGSIEQILLASGVLLLAAILGSKASSKLGVPALLLFLLLGMLAGSEGPGGIPFDDARLAQSLGVVALIFILFSGGFGTDWSHIRPVLWEGLSLATVGVAITVAAVGCFAKFAFGVGWLEAILLGALVASTDAAAVFSVLGSSGVSLKGKIKPLLELESGSNDPMAVFLTVALIHLYGHPDESVYRLIPRFFLEMGVGAVFGWFMGKLTAVLINRLKLESDGLYPVVTVTCVMLTYSLTAMLHGSGFLAVYVAGLALGNGDLIHKRSLIRFHDGLAWLVQIGMFLTLGLLVFPSRLLPVAGMSLALSAFLIFVARPAGVFASLLFAGRGTREKLLISWVGLRGAAPIILATFPLVAGMPKADLFFDVVFFVVITSVLLQGTLIPQVARRLGLESPGERSRPSPLEFAPTSKTMSELIEIPLAQDSPANGRRVLDLGLPKSALIVLVGRGEDYIAPRGTTVVESGDQLLVLADKREIPELYRLLAPGSEKGNPMDQIET